MKEECKDPEGSWGWCPGTRGGTGHNAPLIFSSPEQPLLFMEFAHQPQFCILTSLINTDYNLSHLSVSFLTFSLFNPGTARCKAPGPAWTYHSPQHLWVRQSLYKWLESEPLGQFYRSMWPCCWIEDIFWVPFSSPFPCRWGNIVRNVPQTVGGRTWIKASAWRTPGPVVMVMFYWV